MKKKLSIAIDGPAAAGKSTVAKIVAAKKIIYLYRYRCHVPRDYTCGT